MRLFRTRRLNTLAANPSMPYFEGEKPYVRGWFSATKRSFAAATTDAALDALEREWGVCMLYQYVCRWAEPETGMPFPAFIEGLTRLRRHRAIWTEPAGRLLDRLRLMQAVFVAARDRTLWLVNTNAEPIDHVQLETDARTATPLAGTAQAGGVLVLERLAPGESRTIMLDRPLDVRGRQAVRLAFDGRVSHDIGHGRLEWDVARGVARVDCPPGLGSLAPRSRAGDPELTRLFLEQGALFVRELLCRGRHPDITRFLGATQPRLSDPAAWE